MRKFKTVLVIAGLCLTLAACGKSNDNVSGSEAASGTVQEQNNNNKPGNSNSQQSTTQSATQEETESKSDKTNQNNTVDEAGKKIKITTDGKKLGELQKMSGNNDYIVKRIDLVAASESNSYEGQKELKLGEEFKIYAVTEEENLSLDFYFVKNDNKADYLNMTAEELEQICVDNKYPMLLSTAPDKENHSYIDSTYISKNCGAGLYNVIVTTFGSPYYMVQVKFN